MTYRVTTRTEHRWLIKSCCVSVDVFSMWKLLLAISWYMGSVESCHTSIYCNVSAMCYINRLHHMPNDSIVKLVYNELAKLHQLGFTTWVTRVSEMVDTYLLDIDCSPAELKSECKRTVGNRFINMWTEQVQNIYINPILRTYCNIECNFGMETYLGAIKN